MGCAALYSTVVLEAHRPVVLGVLDEGAAGVETSGDGEGAASGAGSAVRLLSVAGGYV